MKKLIRYFSIAIAAIFLLAACGGAGDNGKNENTESAETNEKLNVVTSFTLIEDIAHEVGGDRVEVYNMVPIGTDPHEYEPLPDDIKAATDADVLFYNGLNLEGGDQGWFAKMMDSVGQDWDVAYELSNGVDPLYLTSEDGKEEEINPHAFLDPTVGIQMTENTRDAFIEMDPDHQDFYEENAEAYLETLREIDKEYTEKINDINEEDRILVTSERAYQYVAERYGLKEGFIWSIDTEENGSPKQIKSLIEFIAAEQPPVLFLETNVDPRPMETISKETGVEIYGEIFSDEIGKPGEEGDTYVKFLQYNIDVIHEGLTSKNE